MEARTLGETLFLLRRRKVLTLEELADAANVTVSTLSRIENEKQTPRPSTLRKIAQALDVDPADLVFDDVAYSKNAA